MFMVEKKSLREYSYSVKDGKSKSFPRNVKKFSQFSCLYFLFLFHANPPTPAQSEENASPNKPRTFAGSPVFAAFDPLVPLEADPFVVVPAFFVTVGVALPF